MIDARGAVRFFPRGHRVHGRDAFAGRRERLLASLNATIDAREVDL
jgi:hypothetical protein